MRAKTIQFYHRKNTITVDNVPAHRTLLDLLRNDVRVYDSKEGCAEGDCGACTVVIAQPANGQLSFKAVNSCIKMAHSVHGMAVFTSADLGDADTPHPIQTALKACHATQCGFCTPGFAMSLFGLYQSEVCQGRTVTPDMAQHHLSGNLCRCTGYRPLVQAACSLQHSPLAELDQPAILEALRAIAPQTAEHTHSGYIRPHTLDALLRARAQHPQAQLVAGCTDVGLWVTKQHRSWPLIIDVTAAQELQAIDTSPTHITIGAGVDLERAWAALAGDRPQLRSFWHRFAGLPVRNAGTMGGNIANGSPIGDSMPVLIALNAHIALASLDDSGVRHERVIPLEDLYTGYKQTCLADNEVISWIRVPRPKTNELFHAYKISKRQEDDISAVALAIKIERNDAQVVTHASVGAGGVGPVPARASAVERALEQQVWQHSTVQAAQDAMVQQFTPISDMRASADYRGDVLRNLLERFWLHSQGHAMVSLEDLA